MARYLFGSGNSQWQAGVGVTHPMNGINWTADFYRVHTNAAGSVDSNYIILGARWNLNM